MKTNMFRNLSILSLFAWAHATTFVPAIALAQSDVSAEATTSKAALLQDFMETAAARGQFRGAAIVVESDKVILEFANGDAETGKRATTPDTTFYLASVSKQFVATAIMLLQEDGKLEFDDCVSKHMPGLPDWANKITIRHLLTHTSGLGDYLDADLEFEGLTNADVMNHTLGIEETEFEPGERYRYSNTGYALLARLVEQLSNKSLPEFARERIFQPLGMQSAVFQDETKPEIANQAFGYTRFGEFFEDPMLCNGAGGMFASPRDMVKWNRSLYAGTLLDQDTLDAAFNSMPLNDGTFSAYGFGWHIHDRADGKALHHTGSLGGFRNFVFVDITRQDSVILLTNGGDSFPLPQIATGITNIMRGKPGVVPNPDLADYLFRKLDELDDLRAEVQRIKAASSEDFQINEDSLNDLGYALLTLERREAAVQVFQAVIDLFPDSANAYDSLAEAWLQSGDIEAAIKNYTRSLELDPGNVNAEAMLKRLKQD